jgi:hypothetical protein
VWICQEKSLNEDKREGRRRRRRRRRFINGNGTF